MGSHSRLSPSSAHRWMKCPGSVREEAKYPEQPGGPAAVDGTHSHTLLEYCINNNLMDPMLTVDKEFTDHEGSFTVDVERAARVVVAINYIKQRKQELDVCTIKAESSVDAGKWVGRDDMAGTADVQIVSDGFLEVIDYKDGMSPVSAKGNPQLKLYGAGAIHDCRSPNGEHPFKHVRLTIIQPKMEIRGIDPISSSEMTADDLLAEMHLEISHAAFATDAPDAPLVPGDTQCKWCRAKGGCKALAGKALEDVQIMFDSVDMAKQAADNEPEELTDDQIREILEAKPLLLQMLEGVEAEAMRRFEAGHKVAGLKVVRGRGSRSWSLSEDEMAERLKKMGIPKGVLYTTKLISPAQAPKVVWENRKQEKKSLSERQIKTLEENYIAKKPGKLTVVSESDSRPEAMTTAETLFAEVKSETPDLPAWLA